MAENNAVAIEQRLGYTWVIMPASINSDNYLDIEGAITALPKAALARFVVDMGHIRNIYSSGIGLLIRFKRLVDEAKGRCSLVNVSPSCREMFTSLRLDKIFTVYATDVEFEISQDEVWDRKLSDKSSGLISVSHIENGVGRINLSGRFTYLNDLTEIDKCIDTPSIQQYVFDLTGLELLDSHGAGAIENMVARICKRGGVCVAYGANEIVRDLLGYLIEGSKFPQFENERQAVDSIGAKSRV